jgi:hypothetical protein
LAHQRSNGGVAACSIFAVPTVIHGVDRRHVPRAALGDDEPVVPIAILIRHNSPFRADPERSHLVEKSTEISPCAVVRPVRP